MNINVIPIIIILIIVLLLLIFIINFGIKMTLMADRKDSIKMLEELWNKFDTDYRNYENLPLEEVTIKSDDGLNLKGYYHNVHLDSKKVVIINHGYTDNHYVTYQFTDVFFEEGYNVLLIDMRSHGASEGKVATYGYNESKDIGNWIDWIRNRVGEDAYIGLHGQSMGAATVLLYGGNHPDDVKFVIEDCGFSTAKEEIKFQLRKFKLPFWPLYSLIRNKVRKLYNFDFNNISPINAIVKSDIPTLFIHGTSDNTVPWWMSEEMYNKKNGINDMIYLVDGADHMKAYSTNKNRYKYIVKSFLDKIE